MSFNLSYQTFYLIKLHLDFRDARSSDLQDFPSYALAMAFDLII